MSDRTLTAAEHPRALSPLVEAVRLENAIKRKRRQVEKLATKLQEAEFERQVFERELERVRKPLVSVEAPAAVASPEATAAGQTGGSAGPDSSVGVAATAEDGHEVPAQNRQPVEPPSDPATGTTRREPPESASIGASTGAVTDSGGSGSATSTGGGNASEAATQPEPAGSSSRRRNGGHSSATGRKAIDETGKRYGSLTVIERAPSVGANVRWRCGCDCGAEVLEYGFRLRTGAVTGCRACVPGLSKGPTCSRRGETGHNVRSCAAMPAGAEPAPKATPPKPRRAPVVGTNPAGPTREKRFTCFLCAGLAHRVEGVRCRGCGLERREEKVRATDFTSGESPLGRAV